MSPDQLFFNAWYVRSADASFERLKPRANGILTNKTKMWRCSSRVKIIILQLLSPAVTYRWFKA